MLPIGPTRARTDAPGVALSPVQVQGGSAWMRSLAGLLLHEASRLETPPDLTGRQLADHRVFHRVVFQGTPPADAQEFHALTRACLHRDEHQVLAAIWHEMPRRVGWRVEVALTSKCWMVLRDALQKTRGGEVARLDIDLAGASGELVQEALDVISACSGLRHLIVRSSRRTVLVDIDPLLTWAHAAASGERCLLELRNLDLSAFRESPAEVPAPLRGVSIRNCRGMRPQLMRRLAGETLLLKVVGCAFDAAATHALIDTLRRSKSLKELNIDLASTWSLRQSLEQAILEAPTGLEVLDMIHRSGHIEPIGDMFLAALRRHPLRGVTLDVRSMVDCQRVLLALANKSSLIGLDLSICLDGQWLPGLLTVAEGLQDLRCLILRVSRPLDFAGDTVRRTVAGILHALPDLEELHLAVEGKILPHSCIDACADAIASHGALVEFRLSSDWKLHGAPRDVHAPVAWARIDRLLARNRRLSLAGVQQQMVERAMALAPMLHPDLAGDIGRELLRSAWQAGDVTLGVRLRLVCRALATADPSDAWSAERV